MSAGQRSSCGSSSTVAAPIRRRAKGRVESRRRNPRLCGVGTLEAIAAAVEPLERRVCLSVSFSGPVNWPADDGAASVAVGDFNGDGKEDLAVANRSPSSSNVSILLGNGIGGFGAPVNFSAGAAPVSVAVGEFNGDDKPDLAVANSATNDVSILIGNGSGGFSAPTNFPAGDAVSVTVADFSGDGNQDLAVADQGGDSVAILLGNGSGSFGAATHFAVGAGPESVTVADFNRDGNPDLAVASSGNASDGNVSVLLGDGSGNFGIAGPFEAGERPGSVSVGDFNEDGRADLAVLDGEAEAVNILLGNGAGSFAAPLDFTSGLTNASAVVVEDFDGDGHADAAVVSIGDSGAGGRGVAVLLGDGSGNLDSPVEFHSDATLNAVAVGDFNGDGSPDLTASAGSDDSASVFLNTTLTTPELTNLAVTSSVLESGIANLSGNIDHGEAGHSFTLVVDWGDGSKPQEFAYPVGTTSFSETHRYLDDNPTGTSSDPIVINLTLSDDAGGSTTGSANLTVQNVAPEATLGGGGGSVVRGVPVGFAGAFTDVGTLDTHEVMWDFGDGTTIAFHSTSDAGALTPTHVYSANGAFIVTMTIRDDDTGQKAVTQFVSASAVGLVADPSAPGKTMLLVGGTAGDDNIKFARVNKTSNIDAFIGTQYLGRFNPTSRLVVFAGAGNDTVSMDKNISLSAVLLGGDGDDHVTGGNGRDVLIGGAGADRIDGGGDDDILIAGTTAHDASLIGLGRILNEWTSSASLATRVNNLKTGTGLSAGFALNASTVLDDGANDQLTGAGGKDWFLFGNGDVLTDMSNQDAATFI